MEVIPKRLHLGINSAGILHVCGGDPKFVKIGPYIFQYSPRMWRWSYGNDIIFWVRWVFSTYVEVIPVADHKTVAITGILHVCGGDPDKDCWALTIAAYSPRMWRWSWFIGLFHNLFFVFSTYVEVIPNFWIFENSGWSILHVCGGDPLVALILSGCLKYSPRMWRWS